jgi:SprT protein
MQTIVEKIKEYKAKAEQAGYTLPQLFVRFDIKGAFSGQAIRGQGKYTIRFNPTIARENMEEFLVRTVPHELAHILQFVHKPNATRPHGKEWDFFCRLLIGKSIPRCHSYEVAHLKRKRQTKHYLFQCGCAGKTHRVSSVIYGRILKGRSYYCGKCHAKISFLKRDFSLDFN